MSLPDRSRLKEWCNEILHGTSEAFLGIITQPQLANSKKMPKAIEEFKYKLLKAYNAALREIVKMSLEVEKPPAFIPIAALCGRIFGPSTNEHDTGTPFSRLLESYRQESPPCEDGLLIELMACTHTAVQILLEMIEREESGAGIDPPRPNEL